MQLLGAKLTNLPLYDQSYHFKKMLQESGLVELIEAGAEMRYDGWGGYSNDLRPSKELGRLIGKILPLARHEIVRQITKGREGA